MKSITVFCGSSMGIHPIYQEQAMHLGQRLAQEKIQLVYGGAKVGLMGVIADAALAQGGRVIGVLPTFLQTKEIAHNQLSELILVDSMHERKKVMNDLSDGAIALPGGFGTLEELFEMLTWAQLGLHAKPVGLLNLNRYYNPLLDLLHQMVNEGFLKEMNKDMLLVSEDVHELLHQMQHYRAPHIPKWLSDDTV